MKHFHCWRKTFHCWNQFLGIVVTYVFAGLGTFLILKFLGLFMELRVKPSVEDQGLDVSEHGEEGYGEEFVGGMTLVEDSVPQS